MITYKQARAAFKAGGRFYGQGLVLIVTRVLQAYEKGDAFCMTDTDGLGGVGMLLYPDSRAGKRTLQVTYFSALS